MQSKPIIYKEFKILKQDLTHYSQEGNEITKINEQGKLCFCTPFKLTTEAIVAYRCVM